MSGDRSVAGVDPIVVERRFPRPRAEVFDAWTRPDHVRCWFGSQPGDLHEATIDLRPGGRWCFIEHVDEHGATGFAGRYLEIVRDELLVFTWRKVSGNSPEVDDSAPSSKVEISFDDTAGGTIMRIVHSSLDDVMRSGFEVGWALGTAQLDEFLSRRTPRPRVRPR